MSGVPVMPPLKPGRQIHWLNGVSRGRGTYYTLARDPFFFGEVGEAYFERRIPRRRTPKRIDILGIVGSPPSMRHAMVLVRSFDQYGFIALRARRMRAVLDLVRRARVRVLQGLPGRGPLKWGRIRPVHVPVILAGTADTFSFPIWMRHPRTSRWMFEVRASKVRLAPIVGAVSRPATDVVLIPSIPRTMESERKES